ncbi:hypothetical protein LTR85_002999 [Meristemomyces frigidus]|nr:hypothetical protein LTR85_002999 [Meristemomyces frigidus]
MFQGTCRERLMPLAIHNFTFGRRYTRASGTRARFEAAPVVVHVLVAFADIPDAFSGSPLPTPNQLPTQEALTDQQRARASAAVLESPYLETSAARNTLAYLNRRLPPTPKSVTSVRELQDGWSIAQTVRPSSVRGRYYDAPSEADMLLYANRPLPATPASVSSVQDLEQATAMTIVIARPNLIYVNKPLPPTPASSEVGGRSSEESLSSTNVSFDSRSQLYSQPNAPIDVEVGTEAKVSGLAWLRRMKRRTSHLLKRLGHSRNS